MNYWKQQAEGIAEWLREIRRHIHQNPELGYKEVETASYIAEILRAEGIDVREELAVQELWPPYEVFNPAKLLLYVLIWMLCPLRIRPACLILLRFQA